VLFRSAEDEFYEIEKDKDKRIIYTTGYEIDGCTSRTIDGGKSTRHQVDYYTFCYKMFAAEKEPEATELQGLEDRTFYIHAHNGIPPFYVKVLLLKKMPDNYKKLLSEIEELHKLMLIYRMIHHDDTIEFAKTNIHTRALELVGPIIDLFSADTLSPTKLARKELLPTLSKFLKAKGKLNEVTLEYIIYQILKEACSKSSEDTITLANADICQKIIEKSDGQKQLNQEAFYSPFLKKVTFSRVYERCRNIFDGESTTTGPKEKRQRGYIFTKRTIEQLEHQFNVPTEIKILNSDTNISNGNNDSAQNAQVKSVTGVQQNAFPEDTYVNDVTPNNITPQNKDSFLVSLDGSIINNNNIIEYKIHNPEPSRTDSSVTTVHSSALIEPNAAHLFTNSRIEEILGAYVSWDLEWNGHGQITAAAFVNSQDNQVVYLLEDFNYSERTLIQAIISKLLDYHTSIGWYTTGASEIGRASCRERV